MLNASPSMLRISRLNAPEVDQVALRLEGEVQGQWVAELRRVCEDALAAATRVVLDVTDVRFIDASGVVLLRELVAREVMVRNASLFVSEQLKQVPHAEK